MNVMLTHPGVHFLAGVRINIGNRNNIKASNVNNGARSGQSQRHWH